LTSEPSSLRFLSALNLNGLASFSLIRRCLMLKLPQLPYQLLPHLS
jgi:hypothetical protein